MANRFDSNADKWRRTTSLPSSATMSWCAWVYITTDQNAITPFFYRTANTNPPYVYVGTASDGTTVHLTVGDNGSVNTSANGTNLSTATWYHLAYTVTGGVHTVYLNGVLDATVTPPNAFTPSNDEITFGHDDDTDNEFLNGRLGPIKIWDGVALTAAEIQKEMWSITPQRTANLYGWYPFNHLDLGGTGHDLTASGTIGTEDGPPVGWGPTPARRFVQTSTAITGDVALGGSGGTIAASGEPVISGTAALGGSGGTLAVSATLETPGTVALGGSGGTINASGSAGVIGDVALTSSGGTFNATESIFPLVEHSSKRYLVDKLGRPFRPATDTWFTLHAHFSLDDCRIILDSLKLLGCNGIRLMHAVHNCSTFGDQAHEPNDFDNNPPFSPAGQYDHPQTAYATRLLTLLVMCHERGFLVYLETAYLGFPASGQGWETEVDDAHNTNTVMLNFGAYLETTFGWLPNIVWAVCGDQVPTGTRLTKVNKIIEGIESVRLTHLLCGELDEPDDQFPAAVTGLVTNMTMLNTWYGIGPSRNGHLEETADAAWSATSPARVNGPFEPMYELNAWNTWETREEVRMGMWRSQLGGGHALDNSGSDPSFEGNDARFGGTFGIATVYPTPTANKLDNSYRHALLSNIGWFALRPSGTGPLVGGTDAVHAGRVLISSSNATGDNHITSAMTSDGLALLAYVPKINSTSTVTFTVDLRSMVSGSNALRARWYNPTSGTFSTSGSGAAGTYSLDNTASAQSFTTPGDNGTTQGDWVLVVDAGGAAALTGAGGTLAVDGQAFTTGDVALGGSGGSLAVSATLTTTGDVALGGSGGTLAASGTSLIDGTVAITRQAGTLLVIGEGSNQGTGTGGRDYPDYSREGQFQARPAYYPEG